jgi:hypothetical protein
LKFGMNYGHWPLPDSGLTLGGFGGSRGVSEQIFLGDFPSAGGGVGFCGRVRLVGILGLTMEKVRWVGGGGGW